MYVRRCKKRTNLYVLRSTGNAYDFISHRRLSGPRAPPIFWTSLCLCSCFCLLDISAAFDTIDHNILLKRLSTWFGFTDTALHWIQSYLSSRSFSVKTSKTSSQSCPLTCGVPQG